MFYIKKRDEISQLFLGGAFGEFRFEIQKRFFAISCVLEDTEKILEERKLDLKKRYDEEMSQVDWSQYEYLNDYPSLVHEEEFEIRHVMVYYALYNSTFLASYSLFESGLRILFTHLQEAKKSKEIIKPSWKFKSLIADYKTVLEIDLEATKEWDKIQAFTGIRNAIAHRNGDIDLKENEKLEDNITFKAYQLLKGNINLFQPDLHISIANKEFNNDFIQSVYSFYNEMEEPIKNKVSDYNVGMGKWIEQLKKTQ